MDYYHCYGIFSDGTNCFGLEGGRLTELPKGAQVESLIVRPETFEADEEKGRGLEAACSLLPERSINFLRTSLLSARSFNYRTLEFKNIQRNQNEGSIFTR